MKASELLDQYTKLTNIERMPIFSFTLLIMAVLVIFTGVDGGLTLVQGLTILCFWFLGILFGAKLLLMTLKDKAAKEEKDV